MKPRAVAYHVKTLKDPDPELRQSSCEMLGALGSVDAIEPLTGSLAGPNARNAST